MEKPLKKYRHLVDSSLRRKNKAELSTEPNNQYLMNKNLNKMLLK